MIYGRQIKAGGRASFSAFAICTLKGFHHSYALPLYIAGMSFIFRLPIPIKYLFIISDFNMFKTSFINYAFFSLDMMEKNTICVQR